MLNVELYDLMMETQGAIYQAMQAIEKSPDEAAEVRPVLLSLRGGFAESPAWFLIQAAEFDPEPLSVENIRVRDIYASERIVQALLELMASEQWLDRRSTETYSLTESGRALLTRLRENPRQRLAQLDRLPADCVFRLEHLFTRIISASLEASTPPGTWCLAHSRNRAPDKAAPALIQIYQYFSDFNAFRDDAHMVAWQTYTREGSTWEAFSLVCAGAASSADDLWNQLAHRGYSLAEYEIILADLSERDWLARDTTTGTYVATERGRIVREHVERLTDEYFYGPWACLTEEEIEAVPTLLNQLCDACAQIAN